MAKKLLSKNEPVRDYHPKSKELISLLNKYDDLKSKKITIPIIIGGKEYYSNDIGECIAPHDHKHILAEFHKANKDQVNHAINSSLSSWKEWSSTSLDFRIEIFKKAADLLKNSWRDTINASTMLNQSKNVFQAEIDAACELIDFLNFNCEFAKNIYSNQPLISPNGIKNSLEYRSLEGFVFAVSPFNFTSIAGNLPFAPALMGNVVFWKPASTSVFSSYFIMKLFQEAGLPDGVINFVPGSGKNIGNVVLNNKNLAGVHFTGSTNTFKHIWSSIGKNISSYKTYPRIVGETGGKDFCIAHKSANIDGLVAALIRGAFEYQGQKCSAMSRAYIAKSIWGSVKEKYIKEVKTIKMGSPRDPSNFINAVIDKTSFNKITNYIEDAKKDNDTEILTGGNFDDSKGYYIEPTTILTTNPKYKTMVDELFGPVLTVFIYEDDDWLRTLELVDTTSEYALTGCVIAENKTAISQARKILKYSAGNFYINDKPTGAVVGQQPFGGARSSGTNDKAGSESNLHRWVSILTLKQTDSIPTDYRYPFLDTKKK